MDKLNDIFNIDSDANVKTYKKGSILQTQGEKAIKAFYVKSGLLRSYTIDEKGKEHIFMFAPQGWIISDIESQEFDQPAELFIECLEDCEVIFIDRETMLLRSGTIDQYKNQLALLFRRIGVLQRRVIMMMRSPAKERYQHFLETYPDLPNRVPQRMIASYLGITPEALSKIRGEMARS